MIRRTWIALACIGVLVTATGQVQAAVITWNASSGLKPDEITPAYTLFDSASPENPALALGVLTLSTDLNTETMGYSMSGSTLDMPAMPVIEFNMRMDSSSSTATQRGGAVVTITTQSDVGNALYFELDKVFFLTGSGSRGPEASIDTNDSFHDYRIEVDGLAAGSTITLYQDNVSVIDDAELLNDVFGDYAPEPTIAFGNNTTVAHGTSKWTSFQHNSAAIPEPSSLALLGIGAVGMAVAARRRRKKRSVA